MHKISILILVVNLFSAVGCSEIKYSAKEKQKQRYDQDSSPFDLLDEGLNLLANSWEGLPAKLKIDQLDIKVSDSASFIILRVKNEKCSLCTINYIETINQFLEEDETNLNFFLIFDDMPFKDRANLASGFTDNQIIFSKLSLSDYDDAQNNSYVAFVEGNLIKDVLPVNQLFTSDFIRSFLTKLS